MDAKPTLQTLHMDCVLQILKHVPLSGCMALRKTCRHLKTAVDEHFRIGVQTLPVLLSAHYSDNDITNLNHYCEGTIRSLRVRPPNCEKITFGSIPGVSQWRMWEEKDSHFGPNPHFQRENYLVLFDMNKFDAFVNFIAKYLPGITKLALMIDHRDHMKNIPAVLSIYQNQLKVLLLEETMRSSMNIYIESYEFEERDNDGSLRRVSGEYLMPYKMPFYPSDELYSSITDLDALEELYFFIESFYSMNNRIDQTVAHQAMNRMFSKLRILHISCDNACAPYLQTPTFRFQSESYEKLEELACHSTKIFTENEASFPQLKKCTFYRAVEEEHVGDWFDRRLMPNLHDIRYIYSISAWYDR